MSARTDLQARVDDYLAERRRLGFELHNTGLALARFAHYVDRLGHQGPLSVKVMADWARHDKISWSSASAHNLIGTRVSLKTYKRGPA